MISPADHKRVKALKAKASFSKIAKLVTRTERAAFDCPECKREGGISPAYEDTLGLCKCGAAFDHVGIIRSGRPMDFGPALQAFQDLVDKGSAVLPPKRGEQDEA